VVATRALRRPDQCRRGRLTISVLLEQLRDPAVEDALAQATTVTITSGANDFGCAVGAAFDPTYTTTSDALARTVHATRRAAHHAYTPVNEHGTVGDTSSLAADGDHPDAAGHLALASAVDRALTVS